MILSIIAGYVAQSANCRGHMRTHKGPKLSFLMAKLPDQISLEVERNKMI